MYNSYLYSVLITLLTFCRKWRLIATNKTRFVAFGVKPAIFVHAWLQRRLLRFANASFCTSWKVKALSSGFKSRKISLRQRGIVI